jgi:hypothetical protein
VRIARSALLVLVASCSNVLDPGPLSPVGVYTLVRLDGGALPAPIGTGLTVRGAVELKTNSHYWLTQTDSAAGVPTDVSLSGSWNITDNALQLVADGGGLLLGLIVSRDTIRMDYRGHQNVYVRD